MGSCFCPDMTARCTPIVLLACVSPSRRMTTTSILHTTPTYITMYIVDIDGDGVCDDDGWHSCLAGAETVNDACRRRSAVQQR